MTLSSLIFTGFLFLAPFLLSVFRKARPWLFLSLNLGLLAWSAGGWQRALVTVIWLLVPYWASAVLKKPGWLIGAMVMGFVYLNRYDWVFGTLSVPYLFAFKLLGLSYILFRQIDFILNRKSLPESDVNLNYYLNYCISFYTLIAGPIQRYDVFVQNMKQPIEASSIDVLKQLHRVFDGYIKVFVLSALFSSWASIAYRELATGFSLVALAGLMITNALYIYFNFSGYCDVVIGMGVMAGFQIPENFNKPYLAQDLSDFWSRWHMTLTSWLTDYVFNPLVQRLSRRAWFSFENIRVLAFFGTFLLAGLWHGSTLNFLMYGLLQGIGVSLSTIYVGMMSKKMGSRKAYKAFRSKGWLKYAEIFVTLSYVSFTFIFVGFDILALWL